MSTKIMLNNFNIKLVNYHPININFIKYTD